MSVLRLCRGKVIDSRPAEEGATIRRRRECLACQKRFTTYEIIETLPLVVIKRDGSRQSFDKSKLINGMVRACDKRKVPLPVLEKIADEIEQELQSALEREITTEQVGEMVMKRLKDVDEVAMCALPRSTASSRTLIRSCRS